MHRKKTGTGVGFFTQKNPQQNRQKVQQYAFEYRIKTIAITV